jgi:hypothetical protein
MISDRDHASVFCSCIQVESTYTSEPKGTPKGISQMSGIHLFHSSRDKLFDIEENHLQEQITKNPKRSQPCCSTSESR